MTRAGGPSRSSGGTRRWGAGGEPAGGGGDARVLGAQREE